MLAATMAVAATSAGVVHRLELAADAAGPGTSVVIPTFSSANATSLAD